MHGSRAKMKRVALILILIGGMAELAHGGAASVPGDVNSLCYYDNFFYNLPEGDFFYYFNDTLLFSEPPDDTVYNDGMRDKFLHLVRRHRQIKEFINENGNRQNATISFDLKDKKKFDRAVEFLALLGLELKKNNSGSVEVKPADEEYPIQYYSFCRLKPSVLQGQLQNTGIFFFKLQETEVSLPWDFKFLSSACGTQIDSGSFFEQMLANKRFSLLLAVLYRLSDRETVFVGQNSPQDAGTAWKRIYLDKKTMMGMLVLTSALRVRDGRLVLPGGERARKFWTALAGKDPEQFPFDFLLKLCTLDYGKLNYLYVFSSFLPEEKRRVLFFGYDPAKFRRLYQRIILGDNEKIRANVFPRIENFSFYSLMLALKTQNEGIALAPGMVSWAQAMGLELPPGADECDFLEKLLAESGRSGRKLSLLHKFISVYSKFGGRLQIASPEFLKKAFNGYERYNTILDFIEKIPLKKPESADALFAWQDNLLKLGQKDRLLYTALAQSLLETIAQAAGFVPGSIDFDAVVQDLVAIPFQRPAFYDGLFAFIAKQGGLDSPRDIMDESYLNFILSGLKNQPVLLRGDPYEWLAKDMYISDLQEMMRSQEVCSLSALSELNRLLDDLAEAPESFGGRFRRLRDALEQLPYPDFSKDAPKSLKDRVMAYAKDDLDRDERDLLKLCEKKTEREKVRKAVADFKSEYLLPNVKDYFLALAYALNAKSPKLRIFMNPNLVRLHDFSDNNGSPWREGSAPGNKTEFSAYYLKGGLSRLHLTFALNWRNQLFEKTIFNSEQTQAMIYNIMAMLPQTMALHSENLDALLVELAVEMLQKCQDNEEMKAAVQEAGMALAAGYHYRRLCDYLGGQAADYHLFFSELRQFGLIFAESPLFLDQFSQKEELAKYRQLPLSAVIAKECDTWGNIYFNSLGSLVPRANVFFPQEVAQLFAPGWLSGEILEEYKIKTAYLAHKSELPPCLIGQFVFDFISSVGRSVYSQNHAKDYHSAYFVLDIMNSAHLKSSLKKLQENGFLRLQ
jgi:hypothetical protein